MQLNVKILFDAKTKIAFNAVFPASGQDPVEAFRQLAFSVSPSIIANASHMFSSRRIILSRDFGAVKSEDIVSCSNNDCAQCSLTFPAPG